MLQLKPQQALNPAYRKVKPNRSSVSNFTTAFQQCLEAIRLSDSHNESEEHIKSHLSSFFKDTFYQDYYINTKDRIDLAIYLGKNAKSNIGVLLEAKRLSNKAEFPTTQNLNKKAIQELLLYYLRERIDHKNNNIKQLIATNGVEWFLFKGEDFYAHFYKNKALVKEYEAFRDGKKDSTNNELFYKEIAAPFIAKIQEDLPFVYLDFNAIQFEKLSDKQLNNLYKLFSPVHWLGERFGNDSNQLNKAFYNELLHIIGLTETKKGSKKLIERLPPKERNDGSLLENAMEQIDFRDKLSQFKKPSQLGKTREEQIFHLALDLCITWVNRILFLKLLEAQLIQYNQDKARFSFLNAQKIENFDELDSLFFQVLAKQPQERLERVQQKYADVPYLNSSLFEPTEHEQKGLFITELDNRRAIPVYGKTKLKDQQNKTEKGNLHTLTYLFRFLDAYDFASDGEESIQEENKSLINASVLGLIFEKINGYKDGSFFTPGFITMYMCRETIRKAVVQKFSEAKQQEFTDFEDLKSYCFHYYKKEDKLAFNQLVNSLKICDPAVGSGHFLVSALNELIAVKSELGILVDENGLPLKIEVSVVNDELVITDEEGDLLDYKINQPESFRIQKTLFHEKQSLIENSLFGVDINPNSVKICRLRLWIELLKHAYYKKDVNEIETLPNIDINIKSGNSLISRFELDADLGEALKESKWNMGTYRDAVQTYRNARNKDEKRAMMRLIKDIKSNFRSEISANDPKKLRLEKAKGELFNMTQQTGLFEKTKSQQKAWKKKVDNLAKKTKKLETEIQEIKDNKIYENAFEWRFEFPEVLDEKGNFTGFDVVIGNPPYMRVQEIKKSQPQEKNYYESKYKNAQSAYDLANIFFELAVNISAEKSKCSYIFPHKFFNSKSTEVFRDYLKNGNYIDEIAHFGANMIFDDADTYTCIAQFSKSPSDGFWFQRFKFKSDFESLISDRNRYTLITYEMIEKASKLYGSNQWILFDDAKGFDVFKNIYVDSLKLENIFEKISQGIATGKDELYLFYASGTDDNFVYGKFKNDLSNRKIEKGILKPFLKGKDVQRYSTPKIDLYILFPYQILENKKYKPLEEKYIKNNFPNAYQFLKETEKIHRKKDGGSTNDEFWYRYARNQGVEGVERKKLMSMEICANRPNVILDTSGFYHPTTVYSWYPNEKEFFSNKVLLTVANSKVLWWFLKTTGDTLQGDARRFKTNYLNPFPIPKTTNKRYEQKIESLVNQILTQKETNPNADTSALEAEIDVLVYKLYGLTYDEVLVVDEGFGMSEEEYLDLKMS